MMNRVLLGVSIVSMLAVGASYRVGLWVGHARGVQAEKQAVDAVRQKMQGDLFRAGEGISRLASELEREKRARSERIPEIENQAKNDPDAVCRKPSDGSLQRLNRRWGAP